MAHEINKAFDTVYTLAGEPRAWHNLDKQVPEIKGFGFEVKGEEVFSGDMQKIEGYKAIYGTNEAGVKKLISMQSDSYTLINNGTIWEVTKNALQGVKHKIVSAGSVKGGAVVFASVEIEGGEWAIDGDKYHSKLNVVSSHDGSLPYVTMQGVTRIVCMNTVRMALQEGSRVASLRHTKNAGDKVEGMEAAIASMFKAQKAFQAEMEKLMEKKTNEEEAKKFALALLCPGKDEVSTRSLNQADEIVNLFRSGKGNNGATRYDIFNGATEFFTHHASDNAAKMFESSEFGLYAKKKESAFNLITGDWAGAMKKGKELLAAI